MKFDEDKKYDLKTFNVANVNASICYELAVNYLARLKQLWWPNENQERDLSMGEHRDKLKSNRWEH